jgi:hypothetical protein
MSGKPVFCKSAMQLKMSTDGLAGIFFPHIFYAYALSKSVCSCGDAYHLSEFSNM